MATADISTSERDYFTLAACFNTEHAAEGGAA